MSKDSEDTIQEETAAYFVDVLNWDENVMGWDEETFGTDGTLGRKSNEEVVLVRYLEQAIRSLNPGLPDPVYADALKQFLRISSSLSLADINEAKYKLIRDGIKVEAPTPDNPDNSYTLRVIDFNNPDNNHFMVVRELWVDAGANGRIRTDIMGFVNGIPLLFLELKRSHLSLKQAHNNNFYRYRDNAPHLFHFNGIVMLGNGMEGRVGTITSPYQYFNQWKRLDEDDDGDLDFFTLLKGMCNKANFLDIIENFILFDRSKPAQKQEDTDGEGVAVEIRKILARNHQYLGVNRAFEAVTDRNVRAGKLGVFWHTQGSGKSYSMVFLARKIHRKLNGNFTFLVLTDRENLDKQIYRTFVGVGEVGEKEKARATSGRNLKTLMQGNPRYAFSLIEKFNNPDDTPEIYSESNNIIVFSDEAHRTNYGLFARNMRYALPNASYMGFTGTPLIGDDPENALTKEVFGDYVSTYDFQRAVEDGATVPLYYDNRGQEMKIVAQHLVDTGNSTTDLNIEVAEIIDDQAMDEETEVRLRKILGSNYLVLTSDDRLETIANDFVAHYTQRWETGKAMLVCLDRLTCIRMKKLIDAAWAKQIKQQKRNVKRAGDEQDLVYQKRHLRWMEETETHVVISKSADELAYFDKWGFKDEIRAVRDVLNSRPNIDEEFQDDENPFRVAIVCAMWLTGFDVESLSTLYIDKPMRSHTLMQAIARANRVYEGKANGLIVDYNGILTSLRKALKTFGQYRNGGKPITADTLRPKEELVKQFASDINACVDYLRQIGFDVNTFIDETGEDRRRATLEAVNLLKRNDEIRAKFEVLARDMQKTGKSLSGYDKERRKYNDQESAIDVIYKKLRATDYDSTDVIEALVEIRESVNQAITIAKSEQKAGEASGKIYDISKINFDRLREEFGRTKHKSIEVQAFKRRVEQQLKRMVKKVPTRINLLERYQEIIEAYNKETDRVTIEETFDALLDLIKAMSEEEQRFVREGFDNEEQLAAYDLLIKDRKGLKPKQLEDIKQIARELIDKISETVAKMDNWTEKESTSSQVNTMIYNEIWANYPDAEKMTDAQIQELAAAFFAHVIRQHRLEIKMS